MKGMLNQKREIATEFDEQGNPTATGESLNRRGDNRKEIRAFLDDKVNTTIPDMAARLAAADVAEMGITQQPDFAGLDAGKNAALGEWKEAIAQLDGQEKKVASARMKVIALMKELSDTTIAHEKVKGEISAEQDRLRNNS